MTRKPGRDASRNDGLARTVPSAASLPDPSDETLDAYLIDMIGQLEGLALANKKRMLAYLLSMAGAQVLASHSIVEGSRELH